MSFGSSKLGSVVFPKDTIRHLPSQILTYLWTITRGSQAQYTVSSHREPHSEHNSNAFIVKRFTMDKSRLYARIGPLPHPSFPPIFLRAERPPYLDQPRLPTCTKFSVCPQEKTEPHEKHDLPFSIVLAGPKLLATHPGQTANTFIFSPNSTC